MSNAAPAFKSWDSDESYIADQNRSSSWSHGTVWGMRAAKAIISYGDTIHSNGWLYHDDTVADFGGNDGFAAHQFFLRFGIKPLVVDCEPNRISFAKHEYGMKTLECFVEDIPLEDNSIDWGFCSHTLEHTRDVSKAIAEIARVVKRACLFILPLEKPGPFDMNDAHSVSCSTVAAWKGLLNPHWIIKKSSWLHRASSQAHIFASPRKVQKVQKVSQ